MADASVKTLRISFLIFPQTLFIACFSHTSYREFDPLSPRFIGLSSQTIANLLDIFAARTAGYKYLAWFP